MPAHLSLDSWLKVRLCICMPRLSQTLLTCKNCLNMATLWHIFLTDNITASTNFAAAIWLYALHRDFLRFLLNLVDRMQPVACKSCIMKLFTTQVLDRQELSSCRRSTWLLQACDMVKDVLNPQIVECESDARVQEARVQKLPILKLSTHQTCLHF